ncbi:protein indeterminate-domain 11-like [Olea europaea var. sylvestris]|uniref:protein indeterminate-domain 11-like n=1 Tax=Olea europaea var. sylvestris TaxID=158386 RepID=UPI000C1D7201|nr:protein indeterminate-domain 11-like [Olea europaea var. sylvestris]XP_022885116.1 protein indeterminate-domain 11-like [Olea europaea var. sylvestris]
MMKGLVTQQSHPLIEENVSNLTSASGEASVSSSTNKNDSGVMYPSQYFPPANDQSQPQLVKKKRNQPGNPDPGAEVIALSPRTLLATNRFVCEICNKGFQRDQNLQLHRRGHNLPWKLKQRTSKEVRKKVYVCPETTCVHHDPSRALGDLTGIKKHFCRKHGEKKWKCEKCSKKYAVQSDWKAHSKTCGTREYRCDCGTLFSRRDSFITHRAFCDALAEERANTITRNPILTSQASFSTSHINLQISPQFSAHNFPFPIKKEQQNFSSRPEIPPWLASCPPALGPGPIPGSSPPHIDLTPSIFNPRLDQEFSQHEQLFSQNQNPNPSSGHGPSRASTLPPYNPAASPHISATALLQKATQLGAKTSPCPSLEAMLIRPHQDHMSAADSGHSTTAAFGLNLSSCEKMASGFIDGLALYKNKAAMKGNTDTGAPAPAAGDSSTSGPSLLHDMMMNNPGFEGSTFEDAFGGIFNSLRKDGIFHAAHYQFSTGEGSRIDGTTRDFLGLRPISHSDILSITGLDHNCIKTSYEDRNEIENPKSWQG